MNIEVKLSKDEEKMLSRLPAELQASTRTALLAAKQKAAEELFTQRNTFSVEINDVGNLVINGLGNRFPMGLRPDSAERLIEEQNINVVRTKIAEARAYIQGNPEKVAAAKKARAEKAKKSETVEA